MHATPAGSSRETLQKRYVNSRSQPGGTPLGKGVEPNGFEPMTSCLQSRRSTN